MNFLIATSNPGKISEIKDLLKGLPLELVTPDQIGLYIHPAETGSTYVENAIIKARAYCQASQLPTLADDSGLEVDALEGQPGLHSARFSPIPHARDADRRKLPLEKLTGKSRPWIARFTCTVAVAALNGDIYTAEGNCEGEIIPEERGTNGFGYDPLFLFPQLGKTMAELSMDDKNEISHRARAVKTIILKIKTILDLGKPL